MNQSAHRQTRGWVWAPVRGDAWGVIRLASFPTLDTFHLCKLSDYFKCVPVKALKTMQEKNPEDRPSCPYIYEPYLVPAKGRDAYSTADVDTENKDRAWRDAEKRQSSSQAFLQAVQCRAPPACCLMKYWTELLRREAKPEEDTFQGCSASRAYAAPTWYLLWVWDNTETHISWSGCKRLLLAHKDGWKPVAGCLPASPVALESKRKCFSEIHTYTFMHQWGLDLFPSEPAMHR